MKVAMMQGSADPSRDGVADYAEHLTGALRARGADVATVVVGPGLRGAARAVRRVRSLRPDLVHVQFAPSAFGSSWPGFVPDLLGATVVTTVHEYGGRESGRAWRLLEKGGHLDRETGRWVPSAAAVVATNAGHAAVLARRHGRTAELIPLAPNVDARPVTEPPEVTRVRLGIPAAAEVVAFFGFVHPVKGIRYLIEAFARLRARGRDALHLLVLGGFTSLALPTAEADAFRAELAAVAREYRVAPHVTLTGHLPAADVSAALQAADVAAFPFTAGATTKSGALLSAFAHRLPTVVTLADPPDPELVDGENVVGAPRGRDAGALVTALERLFDDRRLRSRVAAGGHAMAADRTWPRIADRHLELYARVAA